MPDVSKGPADREVALSINDSRPLVFVTVGTDVHYPFDRLVGWVEAWARARGLGAVSCLVQTGVSAPPETVEWRDYLGIKDMRALVDRAAAVVSHAGPATISLCRQLGVLPIVVPRRQDLGEAVDAHQVALSSRLAAAGQVALAPSRDELWALLDRAVAEPASFRRAVDFGESEAAVERFSRLVDELVASRLAQQGSTTASTNWRRLLGSVSRSLMWRSQRTRTTSSSSMVRIR